MASRGPHGDSCLLHSTGAARGCLCGAVKLGAPHQDLVNVLLRHLVRVFAELTSHLDKPLLLQDVPNLNLAERGHRPLHALLEVVGAAGAIRQRQGPELLQPKAADDLTGDVRGAHAAVDELADAAHVAQGALQLRDRVLLREGEHGHQEAASRADQGVAIERDPEAQSALGLLRVRQVDRQVLGHLAGVDGDHACVGLLHERMAAHDAQHTAAHRGTHVKLAVRTQRRVGCRVGHERPRLAPRVGDGRQRAQRSPAVEGDLHRLVVLPESPHEEGPGEGPAQRCSCCRRRAVARLSVLDHAGRLGDHDGHLPVLRQPAQ